MIPGGPNSKSYSLSTLIMSSFKLLLRFRMTFSSIFTVKTISSLQHHSTFPNLLWPSHSNSNNCHSPLPFHLRSMVVHMRSLLLESTVAQGKRYKGIICLSWEVQDTERPVWGKIRSGEYLYHHYLLEKHILGHNPHLFNQNL